MLRCPASPIVKSRFQLSRPELEEQTQERDNQAEHLEQDFGSSSFWTSLSLFSGSLDLAIQAGTGCLKISHGEQSCGTMQAVTSDRLIYSSDFMLEILLV